MEIVKEGVNVSADIVAKIHNAFHKATTHNARHNLIEGDPKDGDTVLYKIQVRKGHTPLGYASENVVYPKQGLTGKTISCVACYDGWDDNTGGTAKIVSGGVGCKNVCVELCSAFSRGFDFTVTIFGR